MLTAAPRHDEAADDGRFRLAMDSSGIGMAIVDLEGRWRDVNPAFARMFGHPPEAIVGRTIFDLTHPDDVEKTRGYLAGLLDGTLPVLDVEKRYLHADGSVLWVHLNVAVMRGACGEPIYLISQLRDITPQRRAEEALRALNGTLEDRVAERTADLEALNRQQELFAYGVSHDLRAPLRAIDSFAALLETHLGEGADATARDYLGRIRGAAGRMASLIDSLLELSRASRAELRPAKVDLSLLADWSLAELVEAEPGRTVEARVQPGMVALGDERQLKQLMDQLLRNAWKFSRDREVARIDVTGRRDGDRFVVEVRDHGIGFDMRYADKLFEPFQRLHGPEQAGGNGLGLAIAQRIVERHGGRIWAQSDAGSGCTFFVELPAAPDDGSEA